MPRWALAGWQAWRRRGGAVLVADAGTGVSLSRVDRSGAFAGGRLRDTFAAILAAGQAAVVRLPQGVVAFEYLLDPYASANGPHPRGREGAPPPRPGPG